MKPIDENLDEKVGAPLEVARPSSGPQFARRVLSATLPLQVYVLDSAGGKQACGSTVASRSADVPEAQTWWVEPRQPLAEPDWEALLALVEGMQIPGLGAPGQITDALLDRVCRLTHLKYLDLEGCTGVTDDGLRLLARLPSLEHLNLSGANITDRGLEVLKDLPQLKSFRMYHQRGVSDDGVENLAHCDRLERVDLMGTPTGDGAIVALSGKPELREFLAGNQVTDAGMALLKDIPRFREWSGGEVAMSLLSGVAHPTYLWLNLKAPLTNTGLAQLVGLDGLFALSLFGSSGPGAFDASGSRITPAGLAQLIALPRLGWLGCCATLCDDEAMEHISRISRLRFLNCQDAVAGDEGFSALGRSSSIEYIWGRRCYNLTGKGFSALSAMPALKGLSVSCKSVDDAGLSCLPDFPALTEFMPMDVPDEGFAHIGRCERLEALHCMYCTETTDAATSHIAGLKGLKTYQAWRTQITDRSLETLGWMPSLEKILLYRCEAVTNAGLAALAALPRLQQVDLESLPQVTPAGAALFPADVRVNFSA